VKNSISIFQNGLLIKLYFLLADWKVESKIKELVSHELHYFLGLINKVFISCQITLSKVLPKIVGNYLIKS